MRITPTILTGALHFPPPAAFRAPVAPQCEPRHPSRRCRHHNHFWGRRRLLDAAAQKQAQQLPKL
jgi:hypothetical protein